MASFLETNTSMLAEGCPGFRLMLKSVNKSFGKLSFDDVGEFIWSENYNQCCVCLPNFHYWSLQVGLLVAGLVETLLCIACNVSSVNRPKIDWLTRAEFQWMKVGWFVNNC